MASGMNPKKENWSQIPQTLKKPFKSLNTPKWNGRLKIFKWNEIEKKKKKWDPSHLFSIEGIKWKAPLTP